MAAAYGGAGWGAGRRIDAGLFGPFGGRTWHRQIHPAIAVGPSHSVGVREDGTVVATGKNDYGECDVQDWKQIIAVKACQRHTMGLKADGTVIVTGEHTDGKYDVSGWTDIVSIGIYFKPAGWGDIKVTLAGVQSNGSVRVAGDIDYGQNEAENWILFDSTITNKNISQNSKWQ